MKTLVSLIGDQTIPNLEIIKEFQNQCDKFIFFHSVKTAQQAEWIIRAACLGVKDCLKQEIDPFNITEIQNVLQTYPFGDESFILNITGGTKPWIIAFLDKFKDLGAEIYYVTGKPREFMKIFPRKGKSILRLEANVNIHEYLIANGFEVKEGKLTHPQDQAERFFSAFMAEPVENFFPFMNFFRPLRNSSKTIPLQQLREDFLDVLNKISYTSKSDLLDKNDFKYFSGDWLEEWVYYRVKNELNLADSDIITGTHITKMNTPNEMDVMFLIDHQLHVIECKTAVFEERELDGQMKLTNILGETIYKSDALRSKLGLFAKSTILTLSELLDIDLKPLQKFQSHFDRAILSNITIISRRKLSNEVNFSNILEIRHAH